MAVVVDTAAVHLQRRHRASETGTMQTHIARQDIHEVEFVCLFFLCLQVQSVPTAAGVEVGHVLEQVVQPVAADDDRLCRFTVRAHVAQGIDACAGVHVDSSAGIDFQRAVY